MKDKKTFIAYTECGEIFEALKNEEAGRLVKHLFKYVGDKNPTSDKFIEMLFISIKQDLKRDLHKYENRITKDSENGKIGNLKKWHPEIYKDYKNGKISLHDALTIMSSNDLSPNIATREKTSPPDNFIADNDNDSDYDNDLSNTNLLNSSKSFNKTNQSNIKSENKFSDDVEKIFLVFKNHLLKLNPKFKIKTKLAQKMKSEKCLN